MIDDGGQLFRGNVTGIILHHISTISSDCEKSADIADLHELEDHL